VLTSLHARHGIEANVVALLSCCAHAVKKSLFRGKLFAFFEDREPPKTKRARSVAVPYSLKRRIVMPPQPEIAPVLAATSGHLE